RQVLDADDLGGAQHRHALGEVLEDVDGPAGDVLPLCDAAGADDSGDELAPVGGADAALLLGVVAVQPVAADGLNGAAAVVDGEVGGEDAVVLDAQAGAGDLGDDLAVHAILPWSVPVASP